MSRSASAEIVVGFLVPPEKCLAEEARMAVETIDPVLLEVCAAGTPEDHNDGCVIAAKSTKCFFTWDLPEEIEDFPTKESLSAEEHEALLAAAEHLGIKQPHIATFVCVSYW